MRHPKYQHKALTSPPDRLRAKISVASDVLGFERDVEVAKSSMDHEKWVMSQEVEAAAIAYDRACRIYAQSIQTRQQCKTRMKSVGLSKVGVSLAEARIAGEEQTYMLSPTLINCDHSATTPNAQERH